MFEYVLWLLLLQCTEGEIVHQNQTRPAIAEFQNREHFNPGDKPNPELNPTLPVLELDQDTSNPNFLYPQWIDGEIEELENRSVIPRDVNGIENTNFSDLLLPVANQEGSFTPRIQSERGPGVEPVSENGDEDVPEPKIKSSLSSFGPGPERGFKPRPKPPSSSIQSNFNLRVQNETTSNSDSGCSSCVHGYCTENVCLCNTGFQGSSCDEDINECISSPCEHGACENTFGGFNCVCEPGYRGERCDIDEDDCYQDPCLNSGVCLDLVNNFQCQCPRGYEGSLCETEVDMCRIAPCQNSGICVNGKEGYSCICEKGFTGIHCETNIDDCVGYPCQNYGTCVDLVDRFFCDCPPGFGGDICEIAINECENNPCENKATCVDQVDGYKCECLNGFTGTNCEIDFDDCALRPCENGATCHDQVGGFNCTCSPGYAGTLCDKNIDLCSGVPCQNGGLCEDLTVSYRCTCPPGFEGRNCEININECSNSPCREGSTCIDLINTFSCKCQPGYEGKRCELELNECLSSPCENNSTCVDLLNSYLCTCSPGFRGKNCEVDINECEDRPCLNNGTCHDLVNHFECVCQDGYTGGGCEVEVDECIPAPCLNNGRCVDQLNGYICICSPGFQGTECQEKIEYCQTQNCNNGECVEELADFFCRCDDGFEGRFCEINIDDCAANDCSEYSTCVDQVNDYTCDCQAGYTGELCEEEIDECASHPCKNGGTCNKLPGTYTCSCIPGYTGDTCITNIDDCASQPCLNQGTCIDLIDQYLCSCRPGFQGSVCETNIDDCFEHKCESGGACVDGVNDYSCSCPPGFAGRFCQLQIDECQINPCQNQGTCQDLLNGYNCFCRPGFNGTNCQINIDDCQSNPCKNLARCQDLDNAFECVCSPGFTGRYCEININECETKPCENGGTCFDGTSDFECVCSPGFMGKTCGYNINDCLSSPCQNAGLCKDGIDEFECECKPGFSGSTCELNIDECISQPCINNGTCIDMINSFHCSCIAGFQGLTCEINVDECSWNRCRNGGTCLDLIADYKCTCQVGFTGKDCETNVDDCTPEPCKNDAKCSDLINGYQCSCQDGYTGKNCEVNIDDCGSSPCFNNATCLDLVNDFSCACTPGYTGHSCQYDIDECEVEPCQNSGLCTDLIYDYDCKCMDGFDGKNCEVDINECAVNPCKSGGTCVDGINDFTCQCSPGFRGKFCEEDIDECKPLPCKNNGTCSDEENGYSCSCEPGFKGKNCEVNINDCESNPCLHGNCLDEINDFNCDCSTSGYTGTLCDENIDDCMENLCENESTCRDGINEYQCICPAGFSGRFCETNINECYPNPCRNGYCIDGINDFFCNCTKGYSGKFCDLCTDPFECNIGDGCCLEDIVFNSATSTTNRTSISPFKSKTDFFGIYRRIDYDKTGRIVYEKKENSAISKKIRYDANQKRWVATAEAVGTYPRTHWESTLNNTRCVSQSAERNTSLWRFDSGNGTYNMPHNLEIICQNRRERPDLKKTTRMIEDLCENNLFACISKTQCIPKEWRCDNIKDCDDKSDECPTLNSEENNYIRVVNDIKVNPKLSVIGRVIIAFAAFNDSSNSLQNITATAYNVAGDKMVEEHYCKFPDNIFQSVFKPHNFQHCFRNETEFKFLELEVATSYLFKISACNFAGCVDSEVKHSTQNWNCGAEDNYKIINRNQVCDSIDDCPNGKRDEEELVCQGSPFTRNMSLVIFLYMFIVLVVFIFVKKQEWFKCVHPAHISTTCSKLSQRISDIRTSMADPNDILFKLEYEECHESKNKHIALTSILGYILSFRGNKSLRKMTFSRIDEIEQFFHETSQGYYTCMKERFGNGKIVEELASFLEYKHNRNRYLKGLKLKVKTAGKALKSCIPEEGLSSECCGLKLTLEKSPNPQPRSSFRIIISNYFILSHFLLVVFNIADIVKDITFTTAVQHYDTNIIQEEFDGNRRYQQYFDFNIYYVFLTSCGLLLLSHIVTQVYWSMITRKPRFLKLCEHQSKAWAFLLSLVQFIPSTLAILIFAEDTAIKVELNKLMDGEMKPSMFKEYLELLYEEKLIEKLALNMKIIEVVCEAFGQLILQSVVLLRLKTLIQTDYFNYLGVSFEQVIIFSMILSVFSIFATFWNYHVRSKQYFRPVISGSTFLQLITWMLLISTKLLVYVISFINFPGLFFVPVLLQFLVTASVLSFTKVSPHFRAAAWHDRIIHCLVCCLLPLAVSDDPYQQLYDIDIDELESSCGYGNTGVQDESLVSLHSFNSIIESLRQKDKKPLQRSNTVLEKKRSRHEMMLALGLYTFECFSVTTFSALMYHLYDFDSYRQFLEHFIKEKELEFLLFLPGVYGVYISLYILITLVVILASVLILLYYRHLHPRVSMFPTIHNKVKSFYTISLRGRQNKTFLDDETRREGGGEGGGGGVEQLDLVHQILTRISNSNYPTLEAKETSFNQFNQAASHQETINQDLENKTWDEEEKPDPVLGGFMEMKPDPVLGGFMEMTPDPGLGGFMEMTPDPGLGVGSILRNDLEASEQDGLWMKIGRESQNVLEPRNKKSEVEVDPTDRGKHSEPELNRKDEMEIPSPVSILNSPKLDNDSQTSKPRKELNFSEIYDEGSVESEIYDEGSVESEIYDEGSVESSEIYV